MAPMVLGYWKIRGAAQSIRLLLGYTKTEFTETFYEIGDAPDFDRSCWFNVKETLGFDFPNLPYLIDGDVKITETSAILRYIARKHNLAGETDEEKTQMDILCSLATDIRTWLTFLIYLTPPEHYETKRQQYIAMKMYAIEKLNKYIGNGPYFLGNKLSFVDFILYELLDVHRMFAPEIFEGFDLLKKFLKRFQEIPEMKEFMASDKCFKGPLNNKGALFNPPL